MDSEVKSMSYQVKTVHCNGGSGGARSIRIKRRQQLYNMCGMMKLLGATFKVFRCAMVT